MKRFAVITLGCRVNQFESESLAEDLVRQGFSPSQTPEGADICIVNTCAVTAKAAMQSRQAVRRAIRSNPGAQVLVTGCNAQVAFREMTAISGVHAVIPQSEKRCIPIRVADMFKGEPLLPVPPPGTSRQTPRSDPSVRAQINGRARPFIKIQDGCNAGCTYCIVPLARGRSRSVPPEKVLKALKALKVNGYPEAVLTGIHLGSYGDDLEAPLKLLDLLRQIVASGTVERIRLSSIEPNEMTDALIAFAAASRRMGTLICPHFHLPLQSGDEAVLKRMGRPYTPQQYRECVLKILEVMPEAAVGADVMVAFPGETDAAFERTEAFVESLPLAYLHVFPYSPRPGTPAARLGGRVAPQTARKRCARLRELGLRKKARFYAAALGKRVDLVMEKGAKHRKGYCRGISETYIPVWLKSGTLSSGRKTTACIEKVDASLSVFGRAIE